jgi:hypothetical protein
MIDPMSPSEMANNGVPVTGEELRLPGAAEQHQTSFDAYGVKLAVAASNAELLEQTKAVLPPGWSPCDPSLANRRFAVRLEPTGTYAFERDGQLANDGLTLELVLGLLDTELRLHVARKAPNVIFIHAGVVAHRGRTIVLPGYSFSGKTTLVAALVRAGATYFSDEFAVLDESGFVHPYTKTLSVRDANQVQVEHSVDSFGGVAGEEALPVSAIVVTSYQPGAEWRPESVSAADGAMALLANAVPARERPTEVMRVVSRTAERAVVLKSARGEADEIAPRLLAELDGIAA